MLKEEYKTDSMKEYEWSLMHSEDDPDPMKEYESHTFGYSDEGTDSMTDYEWSLMKHDD